MKEALLYQVLSGPHLSEKSTRLADANKQITFKVDKFATKPDIKQAVEKMFNVEVDSVTVTNVKGKSKRTGRSAGRRKNWKKAYVRLKPGHDIDFMGTK
jgi:large subunit ribosomal protein L23